MVIGEGIEWDEAVKKAVFGYKRHPFRGEISPMELLYGARARVAPRIPRIEGAPRSEKASAIDLQFEIMAVRNHQASRFTGQGVRNVGFKLPVREFEVGELVLVAHGQAMSSTVKWPTFKSAYYGPCRIIKCDHPRYTLVSPNCRHSRQAVHARRLMPFYTPAHNLLN